MNYIGKFISNFKEFYNEINSATLTGAIDVIVVKQPDGTFFCSPFHVRFGKIGVLRSREKVVDIEVNDNPVNIHMKLGESGEAFFVEEVEDENEIPVHLATSPLPLIPDIEEELRKMKLQQNDQNEDDAKLDNLPDHIFINNLDAMEHKSNINQTPSSSQNCTLRSSDEELNMCNKSSDEALRSKANLSNEGLDSPEDYKAKRRKKKRASAKRRGKGREVSIPNSSSTGKKHSSQSITIPNASVKKRVANSEDISLGNHEDIFQMDDDYGNSEEDEGYPCGSSSHMLSRSVSLPLNGATLCNEWPIKKMSCTFTGEFHPFSDGDVTPQSSPISSRPPSPKSDTEYEIQKQEPIHDDGCEPSWGWGQLPNVPSRRVSTVLLSGQNQSNASPNADDRDKVTDTDEAEKRSMLGGMLNFMRSTKKMRHMPESEGIYLDSINTDSLDPEVAALYFPKFRSVCAPPNEDKIDDISTKDEDTESGKGPSLPHSPHSVVGAIGGPCSNDSDCDDRQSLSEWSNGVAISLCGGLNDSEAEFPEERFMNSMVTYDSFTETPSILLNSNLVVRIAGKYYNWQTAGPIVMSMILYQKSLPEKTTNILVNEHMPKKKKAKSYSSWWSWRRSEAANKQDSQAESAQVLTDASEIGEDNVATTTIINENLGYDTFALPSISTENKQNDSSLPAKLDDTSSDVKSTDKIPNIKCDETPTDAVNTLSSDTSTNLKSNDILSMPLCDAPPNVKSSDASPNVKSNDVSPNVKSNDVSPNVKSNDVSPNGKSNDVSPNVKSNDVLPNVKSNDVSPNMKSNDVSPNMKSNDVSPNMKSTDFTSVPIFEEMSTDIDIPNKFESDVMVTPSSNGTSSACSDPVTIEIRLPQVKEELSVPLNDQIDSSKTDVAKDLEQPQELIKQKEKYKKSLRLTSEQILSLNLNNGPNEVVFSVTTAYQGTTRCNCNIYFWSYDDKIVISDIDGTITKSDVLGHILPMVGKDWAQFGVAKLFSKIKSNGYQFLYLSARAIGQARITRDYLHSIRQGELCLPEGPLLLSPTSLISALHREVIEKKPEEFKISCLKDIQALFPNDMGNPFYAGFGNKINDTWAYRAVGIPTTRVFTINPRGELTFELTQTFQSSYIGLSDRVDHMFPPLAHNLVINGRLAPSFTGFEEFSYFTYWREPINTVCDDEMPD